MGTAFLGSSNFCLNHRHGDVLVKEEEKARGKGAKANAKAKARKKKSKGEEKTVTRKTLMWSVGREKKVLHFFHVISL